MKRAILLLLCCSCGGDPFEYVAETVSSDATDAGAVVSDAATDDNGSQDARQDAIIVLDGGPDTKAPLPEAAVRDASVVDAMADVVDAVADVMADRGIDAAPDVAPTVDAAPDVPEACAPPDANADGYTNICTTNGSNSIISAFPPECYCTPTCTCILAAMAESGYCNNVTPGSVPKVCSTPANGMGCNSYVSAVVICQ